MYQGHTKIDVSKHYPSVPARYSFGAHDIIFRRKVLGFDVGDVARIIWRDDEYYIESGHKHKTIKDTSAFEVGIEFDWYQDEFSSN